jgi:hypothetical protein
MKSALTRTPNLSTTLRKLNGSEASFNALSQSGKALGQLFKDKTPSYMSGKGETGLKTIMWGKFLTPLYQAGEKNRAKITNPIDSKEHVTGDSARLGDMDIAAEVNWDDANGNNKIDANERQTASVKVQGSEDTQSGQIRQFKNFSVSVYDNNIPETIIRHNHLIVQSDPADKSGNVKHRTLKNMAGEQRLEDANKTFRTDFLRGLYGGN